MTTATLSVPAFRFVREAANPAHLTKALRDILRRKDDRLIADIGMIREDILGPEENFRQEWARLKQPWQL